MACSPGVLMLAAVGLERLEASLDRAILAAADIAELLAHPGHGAAAVDRHAS